MYSFKNDYSSSCAKEILERMSECLNDKYVGYGLDEVCESAREKIKKAVGREDADVHFLVGGTQANLTTICSVLRPHEAVIACESGHINVHETGSVEATGHKVETVKAYEGKVRAEDVEELVLARPDEHMVKPKMVYISDSTEIGTVYTLAELESLRKVCDKYGLVLFMDGARMFSALNSDYSDLTLKDIGRLCDIFYIGGTKNGALFGEAVVICNEKYKEDFRYIMKQRGGLLAKGFLLGMQFDCLFTDDLGMRLAAHSNSMAKKLQNSLEALGVKFLNPCYSNQIFPILPNEKIKKIEENFLFEPWGAGEKESIIRLVCTYNTTEEEVDAFIEEYKKLQ